MLFMLQRLAISTVCRLLQRMDMIIDLDIFQSRFIISQVREVIYYNLAQIGDNVLSQDLSTLSWFMTTHQFYFSLKMCQMLLFFVIVSE